MFSEAAVGWTHLAGAVAHFLPFLKGGASAAVGVEDGSAGVFPVLATPLISTTPRSGFAHMGNEAAGCREVGLTLVATRDVTDHELGCVEVDLGNEGRSDEGGGVHVGGCSANANTIQAGVLVAELDDKDIQVDGQRLGRLRGHGCR